MVGDATDIDWYAPSGEKIETSQDILVSRTDESTSTLTIYHATVDSSGNYKCVAKSGDKEAQAMVQVAIFRKSPPPPPPPRIWSLSKCLSHLLPPGDAASGSYSQTQSSWILH